MVNASFTPKRHPESGIYLFRKRVPERLKDVVGKSEIKFSLQTRDPAMARIRNLEELARLERAWAEIDGTRITNSERFASYLDAKFSRVSAAGREPEPAATDTASVPAAPALSPVSATAASPTAPAAGAPKPPVPLRLLFKSYAKEAQLSPATVKRWTPVVERLIGHLGHDDAAAITRADIVAWKDALLEAGMKNVTVRDVYLAATKAMLQFAVDQGLLAENPAKEVKVRVKKKVKEREKGFDGDEAAKILTATLRPFSHLISAEMKAARRWLPWIGAYTGARINELTPLTAAEFVKRDGIWMIRIRGANNKTRTYREVPLHGHLIEQGLLDYAKSRGQRPLFYDPGRSRGGKDSNPHHKKVAERIAEWVRSLGIDAGVAPSHGWRHRFSSVARFVGMPEDVRNIIQGHAGGKSADDYGETWPLVGLREIEKMPRYVV
jgi:integrase